MPPTNRAAALSPATDMPEGVVVNRVGEGWALTMPRAEVADTNLHIVDPRDIPNNIEIMVPGAPLVEPQPPAPPPSEAELRGRLAEALTRKAEADAQLADAAGALDRAVALRAERQQAVDGYRYLDDAIGNFTVQALRLNGRTQLPAEFRDEIAARDAAVVDLGAAEQAVGILRGEHGEAASHAAHLNRLAQSAAVSLINTQVLELVAYHRAALAAVEASYKLLASFDKFCTPFNSLPFAVANALRAEPLDHRRYLASPQLDVAQWHDTLAALMSDPTAEIEINAA